MPGTKSGSANFHGNTVKLGWSLAVVLVLPAPLRSETWLEVRSPNFVVLSDAGEKTARSVAREFEEIREVFRTAIPGMTVEPTRPIWIYAVDDEHGLKELIPWFWESGRARPYGVYVPSVDRYRIALRTDAFGRDRYQPIYHEYFHLLTSLNYPRLPIWSQEGLAAFWERTTIEDDYVELGTASWARLDLLRSKTLIPLDELLSTRRNPHETDPRRVSLFYAQAWALIHWAMLGEEPSTRDKLFDYLSRTSRGGDSLEAFIELFGDLDEVKSELRQYVRVPQKKAMRIQLPVEIDESEFSARPLSEAEGLAAIGNFLAIGRSRHRALPFVERALLLDPESALAFESLGLYHWFRGARQVGNNWFGRAVQAGSESYYVHFRRAMLTKENAAGASVAEAAFRRTIELNPRYAPAYTELARLCASRPERLDEAFRFARRAVELEPGNASRWVDVGQILMELRIPDEAKKAAAKARDVASTPRDEKEIASLERDIETGAPTDLTGNSVLRGDLREVRCIAGDYFEFVIEDEHRSYVFFVTSPSSVSLIENGRSTLKDLRCGPLSYTVEARYAPATKSPAGDSVEGRLWSLEFFSKSARTR